MSDSNDDGEYIGLCQRISRRISWVDDIGKEFRDATSPQADVAIRMHVVHSVATTTQNELRRLHRLSAHGSSELDESEKVQRMAMYSQLSQSWQRKLKFIEAQAASMLNGNSMSHDERDLEAGDGKKSMFELREQSPTDHAALLVSIHRDIKGIQQLAREFANHVHKGGEDLSSIEANARSTLLSTKEAVQELSHAREAKIHTRRTLGAIVFGISAFVAAAFWWRRSGG